MGQKIRRFRGHESAVNAVEFAADDSVVVSAGYDRAVKMWDARSNSIDPIQSVGLSLHSRGVSDWLHGPYRWLRGPYRLSSTGVCDHTPY
jgi:WD40 repeat protein